MSSRRDRPHRAAGAAGTVALLASFALGCSDAGAAASLSAAHPAVGANPGSSAAVYLDLSNRGGSEDALVGATCDCAGSTSLHVTEDRDGILLMTGTNRLELPAGQTVELHPGGSHIMLEELEDPLVAGSTVEVRLEFESSEPMTLEVPVVPLEDLSERVPEQ